MASIFKLQPVDLAAPEWEASIYKGEVLVRARNESHARILAVGSFAIGSRSRRGKSTLIIPWTRPNIVACEVVNEQTEFSCDGPTEILLPAGAF